MTRRLRIDVRGMPHPQGSLRTHALPNGKIATRYPPAVWAWRHQVQQAVAEAMLGQETFTEAVELALGFDLPRPRGHYGTGRNAHSLRPSAPAHPAVIPDIDKLARAIMDSLVDAGALKDDSLVIVLRAAKRYGEVPGVLIQLASLEDL